MIQNFLSKFKKTKKTTIPYNSKLIQKFEKDHKKVIQLTQETTKAIEDQNRQKIQNSLQNLKMALLGHFMEEDTVLYQYLKEYYKDNESVYALILEFHNSIKEIQNALLEFLNKYTKQDARYDAIFEKEFNNIVNALATRVESEESNLYTLYIK